MAGILASRSGPAAAVRIAAAVGVFFVLPLSALTFWQVRRGAWSTVDASRPSERPLLFAVGLAGLVALLIYFERTQPGTAFVRATAGVLVMIAVCAAVTPWVKVSLHMAAASLAATVLLARGHPLGWLLAAMLPALGWSRIALGRHLWREVALGLVLGACTGFAVTYIG